MSWREALAGAVWLVGLLLAASVFDRDVIGWRKRR